MSTGLLPETLTGIKCLNCAPVEGCCKQIGGSISPAYLPAAHSLLLLMKMEESVYSSKQLSVKDGEVIYSLYEEQYFFPSDCRSFNEELTYLGG